MNIMVLVKQTFETEEKIVLENGKVSERDIEFIINPYDEYAIEEALQLKEQFGGEVTVITIGPDRAEKALRTALAMGADKGIHFNDEALFGDEYVLSKALAHVIGSQKADLIIAGNFAVDSGSGQVAIRVAEELDIPHVGSVTNLKIEGDQVLAERDAEGDTFVIRTSIPELITAQQGLNEPRYPSLPSIMKAKKKPVDVLTSADIDLGSITSPTSELEVTLPPKKKAGRVLEGDIKHQVKELAELLRNEAKII